MKKLPIVGVNEIAQMLGMTRGNVYYLVRDRQFPVPAYHLAMGKVWKTSAVTKWALAVGREFSDPVESAYESTGHGRLATI